MMNITSSMIVVGVFLASLTLISLFTGRGSAHTIKGYVQANRSLGTGVLTITLLATLLEAGDLNWPYFFTKYGVLDLIVVIAWFVSFILVGKFIAPRMVLFSGCMTLGDMMRKLYGKRVEIFSSIVGLFICLLLITEQVANLGEYTSRILGCSYESSILFLGLLVVGYTCLGGMRVVAITDVVQLFCVMFALVLVANVALHETGGLQGLSKKFPAEKLTGDYFGRLRTGCFYGLFPTFLLTPPIVQRMLMVKEKRQAKYMFFAGAGVCLAIRILLALIGFCNILFLEKWKMSLFEEENENVVIFLTKRLFAKDSVLQGVLLVGFLSVLMSTIDSFLHALGILVVRNIACPVLGRDKEEQKVSHLRWVTLCIGIFAVIVGVLAPKFSLTLNMYFYFVVILSYLVLIPLFFGLFRFKTGEGGFWTLVVAFFCTFSGLKFFTSFHDYTQAMLAAAVGAIAFVVEHYIKNQGIVFVEHKQYAITESRWRISFRGVLLGIYRCLPTPNNLKRYAQRKVDKYGADPISFSVFLFFLYIIPINFLEGEWLENTIFIAGIRAVGLLLCVGLLFHERWSPGLKPWFPLYWFFTVCYCVPFATTLFFLQDTTNPLGFAVIIISILFLLMVVDVTSFVSFTLFGMGIGLLLHKYVLKQGIAEIDFQEKFNLIIVSIATLVAGFLFARRKQQNIFKRRSLLLEDKQLYKKDIINFLSIEEQLTSSLHERSSMMQTLKKAITALKKKGGDEAELGKIEKAIEHLRQVSKKSTEYLPIAFHDIAFKKLLKEAFSQLKMRGYDTNSYLKLHQESAHKRMVGDFGYIKRLIVNGLRYCFQAGKDKGVSFAIEDTFLDYQLPEAYKQEIPALRLLFTTSNTIPAKEASYKLAGKDHEALSRPATDLLLMKNVRIAQAHYGLARFSTNEAGDFVQEYVLPLNVKLVLPAIKRFADEDLLEKTSVDAPEDEAFLEAIKGKPWDIEVIKTALKVAKHYHRHQKRKSGEPFYLHPLAVARILVEYTDDEDVIVAALLHDTVEDTAYTLQQLVAMFNPEVASIVDQVSHSYSSGQRKLKLSKKDSLMALFKNSDSRPLLVKLADRLHNMRTIAGHPSQAKREKVAIETRDFFIPLAVALKLPAIKQELEERVAEILA